MIVARVIVLACAVFCCGVKLVDSVIEFAEKAHRGSVL